jgi:hypothetical protein
VVTDPTPRAKSKRLEYEASDALLDLPLPPAEPLQQATRALGDALAAGELAPVKRAGEALLGALAEFYEVQRPALRVLGVRPHRVIEGYLAYELFGDYTFDTQSIRIWMRTAIRAKVTSHRGLLNTLLHEFLHHLDTHRLGFSSTPHTRGFFTRTDALYHLALATPPERRKPLVWIRQGSLWRIDWSKLR